MLVLSLFGMIHKAFFVEASLLSLGAWGVGWRSCSKLAFHVESRLKSQLTPCSSHGHHSCSVKRGLRLPLHLPSCNVTFLMSSELMLLLCCIHCNVLFQHYFYYRKSLFRSYFKGTKLFVVPWNLLKASEKQKVDYVPLCQCLLLGEQNQMTVRKLYNW